MIEKSTMSVQELARQMGISLPKAYELVKEPGFPTILPCGSPLRILPISSLM